MFTYVSESEGKPLREPTSLLGLRPRYFGVSLARSIMPKSFEIIYIISKPPANPSISNNKK